MGDGNSIPMCEVLSFEYGGDRYTAFTPAGQDSSSDEGEIALARNSYGRYEVIEGELADEVFGEFVGRYEEKEAAEQKANAPLSATDYLRLRPMQKFVYNLDRFLTGIPGWFARKFKRLGAALKLFGRKVVDNIVDIWTTFKNGSWKTRVSYLFMGFSNYAHGQWLRGTLFFLMEALFIFYMIFWGGYWLSKFGSGR